MVTDPKRGRSASPRWLLLIPFLALIVPPLYNLWAPTLGGIPFFYWYQIAIVFVTAGLTWYLYRREEG